MAHSCSAPALPSSAHPTRQQHAPTLPTPIEANAEEQQAGRQNRHGQHQATAPALLSAPGGAPARAGSPKPTLAMLSDSYFYASGKSSPWRAVARKTKWGGAVGGGASRAGGVRGCVSSASASSLTTVYDYSTNLKRPVHPASPALQIGKRAPGVPGGRPGDKLPPGELGRRLLASHTSWASDIPSDLDWFGSVISIAPPPARPARAGGEEARELRPAHTVTPQRLCGAMP